MGDVKLFKLNNEIAYELYGESMAIEKSLQTVIENNWHNIKIDKIKQNNFVIFFIKNLHLCMGNII